MKDMTAQSDKDLCPSCTYITERTDRRGVTRECSRFENAHTQVISGRVTDCTDYYPKNLPSLHNLSAIAWEITTNKKTGKVGFITPQERRAKGRDRDEDVPEWG
jgi:hypothetical protein